VARRTAGVFAVVAIALGLAIVVRTILEGVGGGLGLLLGGLLLLAGLLRLYLLRH
jgi:hypothetical protein